MIPRTVVAAGTSHRMVGSRGSDDNRVEVTWTGKRMSALSIDSKVAGGITFVVTNLVFFY